MKKKTVSAEDFDRLFDEGHDISEYMDHESARRPGQYPTNVRFDIPNWMFYWTYLEAEKQGISQEELLRRFVSERVELEKAKAKTEHVDPT